MASTTDEDDPIIEDFMETITNDVTLTYENGSLHRITVTCAWQQGYRDKGRNTTEIENAYQAIVEYTVKGEVAELTGFYPETNSTGRYLYRENLKAIRLLPHARDEVAQRIDDDIDVEPPTEVLNHQLQKGEVRRR